MAEPYVTIERRKVRPKVGGKERMAEILYVVERHFPDSGQRRLVGQTYTAKAARSLLKDRGVDLRTVKWRPPASKRRPS